MINPKWHLDARLRRVLAGLAACVAGVLAAAGAYTESHRVPDQP